MTGNVGTIRLFIVLAALLWPAAAMAQSPASSGGEAHSLFLNNQSRAGAHLGAGLDVGLVWVENTNLTKYAASGYTAPGSRWNLLRFAQPNQLDYGVVNGSIGMVGNSDTVWVYSAVVNTWETETFSRVDGYAAAGTIAIAWNDGDRAMGYNADLGTKTYQTLTGAGYTGEVQERGRAAVGILFNDQDAYGYNAVLNTWGHQPLSEPLQGYSPARDVLLTWTSDKAYGFSSTSSTWTPFDLTSWLGIIYSNDSADIYNGLSDQWVSGPAFSQTEIANAVLAKEAALLWADSGAWSYDTEMGPWFPIGITPGDQDLYQGAISGNSLILWNNDEAWGRTRFTLNQGGLVTLDGTPATAYVTFGSALIYNTNNAYGLGHSNQWQAQALDPGKSYKAILTGNAAVVWTSDEAFAFNAETEAWDAIPVSDPPILNAVATDDSVVFWTAATAYGYAIDSSTVYALPLPAAPVVGAAGNQVAAVFCADRSLHGFSGVTLNWASQKLDGSPVDSGIGGYAVLAVTNKTAYAFSCFTGAWAAQTLSSAPIPRQAQMGISMAIAPTQKDIYGFSAYTGAWTSQPTGQ